MNTRDLLNANLYPTAGDNVVRRDEPLYDTQAIAAGTTEYFFFVTAPGNVFLRNRRLPLAGSEIFFVEEISALLQLKISTLAQANALNELLQQSYLLVTIDNREICKLPGLDFVQYMFSDAWSDQVVVSAVQPRWQHTKRKLPIPILLNSTSAFEFKWVMSAAAATAFDGINARLSLHGVELDKLQSFDYDALKNQLLQDVPVTYYETQVVTAAGAANTYQFFANQAANRLLFSKTFPLSDINAFQMQAMEVFINQPDTPIEPSTAFFSRIPNYLEIRVDDRTFYTANLQDMLSIFAGFGVTLTTTPDLDVVNFTNIRQQKVFKVPLSIPAQSKVVVQISQPAGSLPITGEITLAMRGVEKRRVA